MNRGATVRQDPAAGEEEGAAEAAGGGHAHHHVPPLPAEEVLPRLRLRYDRVSSPPPFLKALSLCLPSLSASSLTVSSSSSRGSLASSRGSLASSRGSLSSISFSDIYGVPQYERHDPAGEPLDPHLRYLMPLEAVSRDGSAFTAEPLNHGKTKRSHDTPQSLASLSSRSSLSSLSPPSSPMDTPYHSAPPDCPLTQMTEEYMEQAARGLLEGLRAQSQTMSHGTMLGDSTVGVHQIDKSHRDGGPPGAFTSAGTSSPPSDQGGNSLPTNGVFRFHFRSHSEGQQWKPERQESPEGLHRRV